ncbi:uncharacterized protein LOC121249379 [Juglans microcarpa x Juglans regia]|uniref:uncharacterized protein LOC121249379 n=1 Tax=Juglans microcarpa x Juglans regia TaxID=2249226 RepID=UPI001B7DD0CD|nr:uncharacterized protein LOC121249379 [Juglans microcarpa x Juglans regia]
MGEVVDMITGCNQKLDSWNKLKFIKVHFRLQKAKQKLQLVQYSDLKGFDRDAAISTRQDVQLWLERDEVLWRQRSRVLWLEEGDQNAKFFHAKASQRRKKNNIQKLQNECGEWQERENRDRLIVNYFSSLFTASEQRGSIDSLVENLERKVMNSVNEELVKVYNEEEVYKAFMKMHPTKAPGPDGMSPKFFQRCWHIIGKSSLFCSPKGT